MLFSVTHFIVPLIDTIVCFRSCETCTGKYFFFFFLLLLTVLFVAILFRIPFSRHLLVLCRSQTGFCVECLFFFSLYYHEVDGTFDVCWDPMAKQHAYIIPAFRTCYTGQDIMLQSLLESLTTPLDPAVHWGSLLHTVLTKRRSITHTPRSIFSSKDLEHWILLLHLACYETSYQTTSASLLLQEKDTTFFKHLCWHANRHHIPSSARIRQARKNASDKLWTVFRTWHGGRCSKTQHTLHTESRTVSRKRSEPFISYILVSAVSLQQIASCLKNPRNYAAFWKLPCGE